MILTFTLSTGKKTYLRKKNIIYFEQQTYNTDKYTYIYLRGKVSVQVTESPEEVKAMINGDDMYDYIK